MTAATSSAPATRELKTTTFATLGVVLAAVVIFAGNYNVPKGENGGTGPAVFTAILCAVIAAGLFAVVLPRVRSHNRAVLVLGILTVLSIVVFWSGVTPILAVATFAVADREPSPTGLASIVRWLAAAAAVLAVVWTLGNSHLF